MKHEIEIVDVIGGHKIKLGEFEAFAPHAHQIPLRIKDLFESIYPKPEKKAGANG